MTWMPTARLPFLQRDVDDQLHGIAFPCTFGFAERKTKSSTGIMLKSKSGNALCQLTILSRVANVFVLPADKCSSGNN